MRLLACCFLCLGSFAGAQDSVVVFNEIHYHPHENDHDLEWIELHNQMAVDVDISGWRIRGDIQFDFPNGTVMQGGSYLVVAASPEKLRALAGEDQGAADFLGPFAGRLSNGGGTLRLEDRSTLGTVPGGETRHRLMDSVSFSDEAPWPLGPDGSGATLAKIDPDRGTRFLDNWATSEQLGGTPGTENFPQGRIDPRIVFSEVAAAGPDFWLELVNHSDTATALEDLQITSSNADHPTLNLAGMLEPNGYLVISAAELGYEVAADERLFLVSLAGQRWMDAVRLEPHGLAREVNNHWNQVTKATPGQKNPIIVPEAIVINEIMYHQRPFHATAAIPGEFENNVVVETSALWQFDESGLTPPVDWTTGPLDWNEGAAPFGVGLENVTPPVQTTLSLRTPKSDIIGTHYFQHAFEFADDASAFHDLTLRLLVDDGAAVYLNGTEIYRANLPEGELTSKTSAVDDIEHPQWTTLADISPELLRQGRNVLAAEVHQKFSLFSASDDAAFAAELSARVATKLPVPAQPQRESDEEWIELYNQSDVTVDLSGWQLRHGVRHVFPQGTLMPPQTYLVVDDFQGTLSNAGENFVLADALGRTVDEVTYGDGGRWPGEADGYGSSLELRDPSADNSIAEAWAASAESPHSEWHEYAYEGVAENDGIGTTLYHELVLGMLDAGEILLDDVSVIEDPHGAARELMQHGDFQQAGLGEMPVHWLAVGTHGSHGRTRVIADPDAPDNRILLLVSTGATEDKHNQLSSVYADNRRIQLGTTYRISFRAKWLSGSNQLNSRLYFNYLQRTTRLAVPDTGGTPGEENSTVAGNLGPMLDDLWHSPTLPVAKEPIEVSVHATDADGIAGIKLTYAINGGTLFSGGTHVIDMDAISGGLFRAEIPGQSAGDLVRFHVTATDALGNVSQYPVQGSEGRALFEVVEDAALDSGPHRFRVLMEKKDREFLFTDVNHMSNDRLLGTVIYKDIPYYNVGIRLKGSAWARNNAPYQGLNIRFDPDHPFRGVHETVALERDPGKGEILAHHLFYAAGGKLPSFYSDVVQLDFEQSGFTGRVLLIMARTSAPFLDGTFADAGDGTVYNLELLYTPQRTIDGNPESPKDHFPYTHDNGRYDFRRMGPDKEAYRWGFQIRSNRDADNYEPLLRVAEAMELDGSRLDAATEASMDIDQWTRAFAMMALNGNDDFYTRLWEHNLRLYHRPEDGRLVAIPWDFDRAWRLSSGAPIIGRVNNAGTEVTLPKVLDRPQNMRLVYQHLLDILDSVYHPDYIDPWARHYGDLFRSNLSSVTSYVRSRASFVRGQLPDPIPFSISTNGGGGFSIDQPLVTLQGRGWINVHEIRLGGNTLLPTVWQDGENWRTTVPIVPGPNEITLNAVDLNGVDVGTASITINGTGKESFASADNLTISEIHYHPHTPENTEFIELWNRSDHRLHLDGARFADGIGYRFGKASLAPGERAVLVSNRPDFVAAYPASPRILGEYSGRLDNSGERLLLLAANGEVIADFTYGDAAPWPDAADGSGPSLVFHGGDPNEAANWTASETIGGNPGAGPESVVALTYAQWKETHGITNEDQDTDGDGLPPLLEFTFGGDPGKNSAHLLPALYRKDDDTLVMRIIQRRGISGIVMSFETSEEMISWSVDDSFVRVSASEQDGFNVFAYEREASLTIPRYWRLRVYTVD